MNAFAQDKCRPFRSAGRRPGRASRPRYPISKHALSACGSGFTRGSSRSVVQVWAHVRAVDRRMAAGGPAGAAIQETKSGMIDGADDDLPGRHAGTLVLRMTLE